MNPITRILIVGCLLASTIYAEMPDPKTLDEQIAKYMTEKDRSKREAALDAIRKTEGITPDAVAEAIQRYTPWKKQKPGLHTTMAPIREGYARQLLIEIPEGYSPTTAYPVVFSLGGDVGDVCPLRKFLDEALKEDRILVRIGMVDAPEKQSVPISEEFLQILHHLRTEYHIDSNRVFVAGVDSGSDSVFTLATFCPQMITGAVCLGGRLDFPFIEQTDEFLQPNRKAVPMAVLTAVPEEQAELDAFYEKIRKVLQSSLDKRNRSFAMWFRYPVEGQTAWLVAEKPGHETWTATELGIMVPDASIFDSFVRTVIQEKMFYIAGTLEGQTIDITAREINEVGLLLSNEIVNLDKPLTIRLNGSVRFEGTFEKRIETMLRIAREEWRFDRVTPIRVVIEEDRFARQKN